MHSINLVIACSDVIDSWLEGQTGVSRVSPIHGSSRQVVDGVLNRREVCNDFKETIRLISQGKTGQPNGETHNSLMAKSTIRIFKIPTRSKKRFPKTWKICQKLSLSSALLFSAFWKLESKTKLFLTDAKILLRRITEKWHLEKLKIRRERERRDR